MKINLRLRDRERSVEMKGKPTVSDVLEKLEINTETVIVKRGKDILLEEDEVLENEKLELIRIISGG